MGAHRASDDSKDRTAWLTVVTVPAWTLPPLVGAESPDKSVANGGSAIVMLLFS